MKKSAVPSDEPNTPQPFTVIGFWPDTEQRFCDVVSAANASMAENLCLQDNPGVAVCGVIAGSHPCLDTSPRLAFS